MSVLEWIGVIAIVVFILQWISNIYKSRNPEKFSKDPNYSKRQFEFNRIGTSSLGATSSNAMETLADSPPTGKRGLTRSILDTTNNFAFMIGFSKE